MKKYKISVQDIQKALMSAWQAAPEYVGVLAKSAAPLFDFVKKHQAKFLVGAALVVLGTDDLRVRHQRKKERAQNEECQAQVSETLQKHEAEIQALKAEAEGAQNLKVINELLCKAVLDLQESEKENEDKQKAGSETDDK